MREEVPHWPSTRELSPTTRSTTTGSPSPTHCRYVCIVDRFVLVLRARIVESDKSKREFNPLIRFSPFMMQFSPLTDPHILSYHVFPSGLPIPIDHVVFCTIYTALEVYLPNIVRY